MHRFFVPKEQIPLLTGQDAHHLKNVLRAKVGDPVELLDGNGTIYSCRIAKIGKETITCKVESTRAETSEPKVKVTLAQSLPKGSKMELIIQKSVELGVNRIIPLLSERSVSKEAKLPRWEKIAREAAEQSKRGLVPEITQLKKIDDIFRSAKDFDLALIPWELETDKSLKSVLTTNKSKNLLLLIGPEGGFSQDEVKRARESGFIPVSLGKRILRAETAAIATLAAVMYELD